MRARAWLIAAGSDPAAQALMADRRHPGRGHVRPVPHREGRRRPAAAGDATPADGASCFVNPLTALGMVETMRREGHKALVHTAAASNLGQMLNKICLKDGSTWSTSSGPRRRRRSHRHRAKYVVDSSSANFLPS